MHNCQKWSFITANALLKRKKKKDGTCTVLKGTCNFFLMFQRSEFAWQHIQLIFIMTHTNRHWHLNSNSVELIPQNGTRGVSLAHVGKYHCLWDAATKLDVLHLAKLSIVFVGLFYDYNKINP